MVTNGKDTVCYGCGVCAAVCPKECIEMKLSDEGFWVPFVDKNVCIDCGLCDKVCNYIDRKEPERVVNAKAYAVVNKDSGLLARSTSGGAGIAIARLLLSEGYKLVGVEYDTTQNIAKHFVTDSLEEFELTLNSKYIPSFTTDAFKDLMNGDKYAVFGTPCQIDGLMSWVKLRKKEDNFFFVDLFCHGVPSYLHWNAYLKHHLRPDEKLRRPIFRDKRNGWHAYTMSLETDKRLITTPLQKNDLFQNIFFGNFSLNLSCYKCVYRGLSSSADLRMGDLWGGKYAKNETGITGVVAMTTRGKSIVDKLPVYCFVDEEAYDVVAAGQMHHDLFIPQGRTLLLKALKDGKSLKVAYYKYARKMWIKNLFPYSLKKLVKQIIYTIKK